MAVDVDGRFIRLTVREFQILEVLALREGKVVTKAMLLHQLYGGMDEPAPKVIDVFICKLRRKITLACDQHPYIDTIWGRGYIFRDYPVETGIVPPILTDVVDLNLV